MERSASRCPGCGLELPPAAGPYRSYFNANAECWSVYCEVLEREYSDAALFGRVHQLSVDAYAVQHAGGPHPDKSVDVHLVGLHLVLEQGVAPPAVPPLLQRLASRVEAWPHFEPPAAGAALTVADVALAASAAEHEARVRAWAAQVWAAWREHHGAVAALAARHLG